MSIKSQFVLKMVKYHSFFCVKPLSKLHRHQCGHHLGTEKVFKKGENHNNSGYIDCCSYVYVSVSIVS